MRRSIPSDERLERRARELNRRHFGGRLSWTSIGFAEMASRWGSCSFTDGAIRVATRAAKLPEWVIDYLVVHELAHLEHSDHGPAFHEMENRYPLTERAKGYLMALDQNAGATTGPAGEATMGPAGEATMGPAGEATMGPAGEATME